MKKHILLGTALASLFALGACDYNEDNFPGFDEKETITDVSTDTLVLADAHYGKIASMPKNQGIALAKDPEGQTYLTALNQLGKTKMFTDMVAPEDYLPAFVDSLYAYLSDGSKVLVQYNIGKEQPEYLSKINEAQTFDLTSDNYATVWGESMVVKYLTPSTLKKLPALLKEGIKNPKTGDVCQVNYAWSETEPSTGGGAVKMVYQKVTSIDAEGGNYVIVAPTKDNTWIPFGQFKDPDKTYGYMEGEPVEIADGFITSDVSNHIMTLTPTEKGFTMQRPDGKFIYQSGTFNSFNIGTSIPEGGDWSFAYNYDRKAFDVKNVEKDKIIKLNFYEKGNSYSYGSYPNASALYQYDGSAWTAYEESASIGIRVMQPADYVSTGSDYLSDADAVLPVYLKNAFPYAQSGDVKAVVYFGNKEYDVMADEYGFDGTAWVKKNTETETAEMAFLKTDGKWMEAKEYYSNDFAGELHNDAQIVNVKLDGMNYVWSAGAGYTRIKASGYYQRNRDTEAWLVTGEVDLTEAIAPQMVFTASADYLYGGKIENAVSVHVSENYIPAASTATEEEKIAALQGAAWSDPLSFEWPTSSKEIEMRTSMADYVGKKVYVAFRYASNTDPGFAPTFYMSNFVVKE